MKVIVTGGGAVGRHLAVDLVERGHEVTLIEQDRALVEKLRAWAPGVDVRFGDACEPSVLEECDASSVDVLVAATGDDEDNLVSSLLAKQEFAVPRVLARVNHPKNEWLFNEQWGVDAEVSPPHILTAMVEEAARAMNIDLTQSWMIGDSTADIAMAERAGLRSVLVATGEGGRDGKWPAEPTLRAADFPEAVERVLSAAPIV